MRLLAWLFFVLAALCSGLWAFAYAFAIRVHCGYSSSPTGVCESLSIRDFGQDDLINIILVPGLVVITLWGLGFLCWRHSR